MVGQECRLGPGGKYCTYPTTREPSAYRSSRPPYLFSRKNQSDLSRSVTSSVLNGDRSTAFHSYRTRVCKDDTQSLDSHFSDDDSSAYATDDGRRRSRKRRVWLMALYLLAAAITFFTVMLWRMGYIFKGHQGLKSSFQGIAGSSAYDENGNMICNGHVNNCKRRANEIMYATVHNAMSSREDKFLAFNNLYPLEDALMAGFRGLTIDSCDCARVGIQLCHSVCLAGYRRPAPVFSAIVDFMLQNPHEVVIIELQILANSLGPLFEILSEVDGLSDLMYRHPGLGEPWPTLEELIEMDKRLIVFQHDGPNCDEDGVCPPGVHNTYTYMFETPFGQKGPDELMNTNNTCVVSRGWSNADFVISNHFANDNAGLPSYDIAAVVNTAKNVQRRLDACLNDFRRETINLLVVDFWEVGDVLQVVEQHNSDLPPITEEPSSAPSLMPTVSPQPSPAPSVGALDISELLTSAEPSPSPTAAATTEIVSSGYETISAPPTSSPSAISTTTAYPTYAFYSSPTAAPTMVDTDDYYTTTVAPTVDTSFYYEPTATPAVDTNDYYTLTTAPTVIAEETFYYEPTATPTVGTDFYYEPTAGPTVIVEENFYYEPTAAPTVIAEESFYYEPTAAPSIDDSVYYYEPTADPTEQPVRLNVINSDPEDSIPTYSNPVLAEEQEQEDSYSNHHGLFLPEKDTPDQP